MRAYVDAFNRGDVARLHALFAPDAVIYGVLGPPVASRRRSRSGRCCTAAFAVELSIESLLAAGDTVVRYAERGRFVGAFRGAEPTSSPTNSSRWNGSSCATG